MRGWVYVISSPTMPGLVKVGYTRDLPECRAADLVDTASPGPFVVEYAFLVEEPERVERSAHTDLRPRRHNLEWFRCLPEEAVAAVKRMAAERGCRIYYEEFPRANAAEAERLRRERDEAENHQRMLDGRRRAIKAHLHKQGTAVEAYYRWQLSTDFPDARFSPYWLGCTAVTASMLWLGERFNAEALGASIFVGAIVGGITAFLLKEYVTEKRRASPAFSDLAAKKEAHLVWVQNHVVWPCARCGKWLWASAADCETGSSFICGRCRAATHPLASGPAPQVEVALAAKLVSVASTEAVNKTWPDVAAP